MSQSCDLVAWGVGMRKRMRGGGMRYLRSVFRTGNWRREVVLLGGLYVMYELIRGVAPERKSLAFQNADRVQSIERWLHIDIELWANGVLRHHQALADFCSIYYQVAHEGVAAVVLIWLWTRHRQQFAALRSTLVIVSLVSLLIYWVVPLAPPRFAEAGIVDTMLVHPVLFAGMKSVTGLVNLYAAMPSVHIAWAVWCAIAFTVAGRSSRRWLVWIYPLVTAGVVLGTGNHFTLDIIVGAALVIGTWSALAVLHPHRARLSRRLVMR